MKVWEKIAEIGQHPDYQTQQQLFELMSKFKLCPQFFASHWNNRQRGNSEKILPKSIQNIADEICDRTNNCSNEYACKREFLDAELSEPETVEV